MVVFALIGVLGQFSVTGADSVAFTGSDESVILDVTVRNDSASSIAWAEAELRVNGCDGSAFNVTNLNPAWTDWLPGTERTSSFVVHHFEQASCGLCGSNVDLSAWIRNANGAPTQAAGTIQIGMGQQGVQIVEQVSEFAQPLGFIGHSVEFQWPLATVNPIQTNLLDPDTEIYLAFDWDTFGFNPDFIWNFYVYPIRTVCGINHLHMPSIPEASDTLLDPFGLVAGSANGVVQVVPRGGAGGAGGLPGSGWNFFDIGDFASPCGTVRNQLNYSNPPYSVTMSVFQVPIIVREMAIFIGVRSDCVPPSFVFGTSPSPFQITDFSLAVDGTCTAEVEVPSAWKSGLTLASAYQASWHHVQNGSIAQLSVGNPQSLSFSGVLAGWDASSRIECRIEHIASGSQVSVRSPFQPITAQLQSTSWQFAEVPADDYLDPGEIGTFTWNLMNTGAGDVTALSVTAEESPDWVASSGVLFAPPGTISMGAQVGATTTHELLRSGCCTVLNAYLQSSFMFDGTQFDVPIALPITVNADDVVEGVLVEDQQLRTGPLPNPCVSDSINIGLEAGSYDVWGYATEPDLVSSMSVFSVTGVGSVSWGMPPVPAVMDPFLFVRVQRASDMTQRVWSVPINVPMWQGGPVPPLNLGLPSWTTMDTGYDIDLNGVVNILDYVELLNLNECL